MASRLIAICGVDTTQKISTSGFKKILNRQTISSELALLLFCLKQVDVYIDANLYYLIYSVHAELSLQELPVDMTSTLRLRNK